MKKKIVVFIVITIILASAIGGYFYWEGHHVPSISIVKDNFSIFKDIASANEKSQWLTYTNAIAKYSFKYPPESRIDVLSDRALYFGPETGIPLAKVRFMVFYQDEFEHQLVFIDDKRSFYAEVNRRIGGNSTQEDKITGHETSFMGKPAIVTEDKDYPDDMSIFVWHGTQILQIDVINSDQLLLSKILSTFIFSN